MIKTTIKTSNHHKRGTVIIPKIKAPIKINGTRKTCINMVIIILVTWFISLIRRTTKLPVENFSIFPKEKF